MVLKRYRHNIAICNIPHNPQHHHHPSGRLSASTLYSCGSSVSVGDGDDLSSELTSSSRSTPQQDFLTATVLPPAWDTNRVARTADMVAALDVGDSASIDEEEVFEDGEFLHSGEDDVREGFPPGIADGSFPAVSVTDADDGGGGNNTDLLSHNIREELSLPPSLETSDFSLDLHQVTVSDVDVEDPSPSIETLTPGSVDISGGRSHHEDTEDSLLQNSDSMNGNYHENSSDIKFRDLNHRTNIVEIENDSGHISDTGSPCKLRGVCESDKSVSSVFSTQYISTTTTTTVINQCLSTTVTENTHSSANYNSCDKSDIIPIDTQHHSKYLHVDQEKMDSFPYLTDQGSSVEHSSHEHSTSNITINSHFETEAIDKTFRSLELSSHVANTSAENDQTTTDSQKDNISDENIDSDLKIEDDDDNDDKPLSYVHRSASRAGSVGSSTDSNEIIDFVGSFGDDEENFGSAQADVKEGSSPSNTNVAVVGGKSDEGNVDIPSSGSSAPPGQVKASTSGSVTSVYSCDRQQSVTDVVDTSNIATGNYFKIFVSFHFN